MTSKRLFGLACALLAVGAVACSANDTSSTEEGLGSVSNAVSGNGNGNAASSGGLPPGQDANCKKAAAKDPLIAQLVYDSWIEKYPLTRLSVELATGNVVGPALTDAVAGDLAIINTVPDARASVVRALKKVTGLADYGMRDIGFDSEACSSVPGWSPSGAVNVKTGAYWVHTDGVNEDSWRTTHREFGKECPLIKTVGNRDVIDPPGDGSTNSPVSVTVSATGVKANAFGLCPTGTTVGTFCMLTYGTGMNYTGRTCQLYYGSLRCLLAP